LWRSLATLQVLNSHPFTPAAPKERGNAHHQWHSLLVVTNMQHLSNDETL
jgi:hypothetical protein